ncbi:hypothetical protein [Streptomyces bugieae]|uniref:Uncharacterized protein n=1 Tax=Streptomyces bugieae TaxID=3098223 RepID=A0ABU7NL30_9ACTN|nr:hypothetical protein [Streptomyces sp. DSM 41528]
MGFAADGGRPLAVGADCSGDVAEELVGQAGELGELGGCGAGLEVLCGLFADRVLELGEGVVMALVAGVEAGGRGDAVLVAARAEACGDHAN